MLSDRYDENDAPFTPLMVSGGYLTVSVIPYGATMVDLRLAGVGHPLILGFRDLRSYAVHRQFYLGAVVGRHANRIAYGRTTLAGETLVFETNAPPHHSHGGSSGFSTQVWDVEDRTDSSVRLVLQSPDGAGGYPGELWVSATYRVFPPATLRLTLEVRTTRRTLVNLCHHPYFNLDGRCDIDQHQLQIAADAYLPCDENILPTGEVCAVAGTPFDFRAMRRLAETRAGRIEYNNTFCLVPRPDGTLFAAAHLRGSDGTTMELWTTQPGLHLYTGYKLHESGEGLEGRRMAPRAGICLEAQNWPDSPNRPAFPSAELAPGDLYRQVTEYRFGPR